MTGEIADRVHRRELQNRVMDPMEVVKKIIPQKGTIACSGMALMSTPKLIPMCLAKYAQEAGKHFEFNLITCGAAAPELDGSLAAMNAIKRRYSYQNNPTLRQRINEGVAQYLDIHFGEFPRMLRGGFLTESCGPIDLAVVEAVAIKSDGGIIPSLAVDITPTIIQLAKKVIVEVNTLYPLELEGIHDIYTLNNPPLERPIPIATVGQRIGVPYVPCDPKNIVAIVESDLSEKEYFYGKPTSVEEKIAEKLMEFLEEQVSKGRLPRNLLPLETGVGSIGEAIVSNFTKSDFRHLKAWGEVVQGSYFDLIDAGRMDSVSGAVLMAHEKGHREKFISNLNGYKQNLVLRPIEITNSHEMIGRLGVIGFNQAVEIDIYGFVNSTHVLAGDVVNGIGGSGEFARDAYLSVFLTSSVTKGGSISRFVPMVTHVDTVDHDVDVVISEQGCADLRGKSPRERAKEIIEKCVHSDYKDMLYDYFDRACKEARGHMPHLLDEAHSWHLRYAKNGSMR